MEKSKNSYVNFMDNLPFWAKLVLSLPFLDITWGIYRIVKGISTNDTVLIFVGIIWTLGGIILGGIIDTICTLLQKRPTLCV